MARNAKQNMENRAKGWYNHYYKYLMGLTYQLFEWENLPGNIDPRYLEMMIHDFGFVGFYKDPKHGFIVSQGSMGGQINHYLNPTTFKATSPQYTGSFFIHYYNDLTRIQPEEPIQREDMGVVIFNNDLRLASQPSIKMFAQDLADLKQVIYVNQNAQKTPVILLTNDRTLLTMKNLANQIEGNSPFVLADEKLDINEQNVRALDTKAPYVVDKLNQQKNAVWNELMTYLGIKNTNMEKKERMITDEATSNNEQIQASANIMLKARQESVERIKDLYPELSDLNVKLRAETIEQFEQMRTLETGGERDG